jgi:hypothetical protein
MIDVMKASTDPNTKHILVAAINHNNNTITSNAKRVEKTKDILLSKKTFIPKKLCIKAFHNFKLELK